MSARLSTKMRKFIDIGANLCDGMYQGQYHGSSKHPPDLDAVLQRAADAGVERIMVTGTSLQESRDALTMAREIVSGPMLYSTVGCHPTRCGEFVAENTTPYKYLDDLLTLIQDGTKEEAEGRRVVAVGECGLDYARTQFCDPQTQRTYFEKQLTLAEVSGLPLFLHCRDAAQDFVSILTPWRDRVSGGVVHSFDGSQEELKMMLDLDLFIGINGCSLKTEENLAVVAQIPLNRLLLETDSPWCEVKPTHAGHKHVSARPVPDLVRKKEKWQAGCLVKGRNEPNGIVQVLQVLAGVRGEDPDALAAAAYRNTLALFFPKESEEKEAER